MTPVQATASAGTMALIGGMTTGTMALVGGLMGLGAYVWFAPGHGLRGDKETNADLQRALVWGTLGAAVLGGLSLAAGAWKVRSAAK